MNQSLRRSVDQNASDNVESIQRSFGVPDWYLKNFATNIRIRTETVTTLLEQLSFGRILDIGCGDGSLTIPLLSRSRHITYLDQSAAMLALVASRIGNQDTTEICYVNSGFMEAELPPASFDLVTCIGVLAYVEDVDALLKKIRIILKPGGRLLFECTDAYHFLSRSTRAYRAATSLLKPKRFGTYKHRASKVVAATEAQGLSLEKKFCYAYSVPLIEKFIAPPTAYKLIRGIYGDILDNRRAWLGNQYIFSFRG